jgi:hypothetical protein
MNYQHKDLADGRWAELSFSEQMANIGSEVERALKWKEKGNEKYSENAFFRALELIDLTIKFNINKSAFKELTRIREGICGFFTGDNIYGLDANFLRKYFYYFNYSARKAT